MIWSHPHRMVSDFYFDAAVACGYFVALKTMLDVDIPGLCEKGQIPQNNDNAGKFEGFVTEEFFSFDGDD
jgi:hypothetical protein